MQAYAPPFLVGLLAASALRRHSAIGHLPDRPLPKGVDPVSAGYTGLERLGFEDVSESAICPTFHCLRPRFCKVSRVVCEATRAKLVREQQVAQADIVHARTKPDGLSNKDGR